jgi:hypothetical protein
METERAPKTLVRRILNWVIVIFFIMILVGVALGPVTGPHGGFRAATHNVAMQQCRQIGLCLHQYSIDHGGHYPEAKTSTEIFQQLIDQKYVSDPQLFYIGYFGIPGKVIPQSDHLSAENVCYDVTCCVDSSSPDNLPVVFLTGFKVNYQAGAKAIPTGQSEPVVKRTWSQWWNGTPDNPRKGIAVSNKDSSARWIRADEDGAVSNFIPADFDPKGKTYRQLTP